MNVINALASYQTINMYHIFKSENQEINDSISNTNSSDNNINDDATNTTISSKAIELYNSEKNNNSDNNQSNKELTPEEEQQVAKLKTTDAEVKRHENAHKAAAGGLKTSAPNYEYETGPDGKKYAVAGDVNISYEKSSDPNVNLKNAQKLKAAALAPAEPSAQDRSVARKADMEIAKAKQEILEEQQNKDNENDNTKNT